MIRFVEAAELDDFRLPTPEGRRRVAGHERRVEAGGSRRGVKLHSESRLFVVQHLNVDSLFVDGPSIIFELGADGPQLPLGVGKLNSDLGQFAACLGSVVPLVLEVLLVAVQLGTCYLERFLTLKRRTKKISKEKYMYV